MPDLEDLRRLRSDLREAKATLGEAMRGARLLLILENLFERMHETSTDSIAWSTRRTFPSNTMLTRAGLIQGCSRISCRISRCPRESTVSTLACRIDLLLGLSEAR
jgi:hypothetical protein